MPKGAKMSLNTARGYRRLALLACLMLAGCTGFYDSTDLYRDPVALGRVPQTARLRATGTVGWLMTLSLGGGRGNAGTFIIVAGDKPILSRAVSPRDLFAASVTNPTVGDCQVRFWVDGAVVAMAKSKIETYRLYFVPA
jgi:hypothetical protein